MEIKRDLSIGEMKLLCTRMNGLYSRNFRLSYSITTIEQDAPSTYLI